jgi:hypothetical protein
MAQREALFRRYEMMKLDRGDGAVVAAHAASTPGVIHKQPLDLASAARHGLGTTLRASVAAAASSPEYRRAVMRTAKENIPLKILRGATPLCPLCLQAVLAKPVPYRRLAQADGLCYLRARHPGLDQRLQILPSQPSPGGVPLAVRRFEPMFLDPVADRAFVQPEPLADLRKRQAVGEQLLERNAIHAPYCLQCLGRNARKRERFRANSPTPTGTCTRPRRRSRRPPLAALSPPCPPCRRAPASRRGRTPA